MSIQVTYETDHISLLRDSIMSNALNFCFYLCYCNLKEKDHTRRIINKKYIYIYMRNQYYHYFDLPKIWVGRGRTTNKVPSPNSYLKNGSSEILSGPWRRHSKEFMH